MIKGVDFPVKAMKKQRMNLLKTKGKMVLAIREEQLLWQGLMIPMVGLTILYQYCR